MQTVQREGSVILVLCHRGWIMLKLVKIGLLIVDCLQAAFRFGSNLRQKLCLLLGESDHLADLVMGHSL
jgi:hypothetical protein